jgi:hypothetical protein
VVIASGIIAGAGLSPTSAGVIALWVAVLSGWIWLAMISVHLYRLVPHPDLNRRTLTTT